jgi:hypothetical protein
MDCYFGRMQEQTKMSISINLSLSVQIASPELVLSWKVDAGDP